MYTFLASIRLPAGTSGQDAYTATRWKWLVDFYVLLSMQKKAWVISGERNNLNFY